ncbi:MAG: HAMP domain-containing histidine kinase [Betaproteobacteria bacterium]|nr:HAMP domain-containing histidine kinase [Betaproteobacteria bacterium]
MPHEAPRPPLPDDTPRRLLMARAAMAAAELGLLWLAVWLLEARLPLTPVAALWLAHLALIVPLAVRGVGMTHAEAALHLAADAALLAGLVYFTGGYANPSISLLLAPLILGAVLLPGPQVWLLAAWVGGLYTLLMRHYQPLILSVSDQTAVDLHLAGMWLNFLLTAALVAAFVGSLASALRRRDAALAQEREQRLRDEQLFALGLQAAAAAHDLATPLASVRLTLDGLREEYARDDELELPLERMSGQLERVETVLQRLGDAARSRNERNGGHLPADQWLARTVERWGLLHPDAGVTMDLPAGLPDLAEDVGLETVLMTLLNNAADASAKPITLSLRQEGARLLLRVRDQGAGLSAGKSAGWGVGLELAQAAVARRGGLLTVRDAEDGGALAELTLPLEGRP